MEEDGLIIHSRSPTAYLNKKGKGKVTLPYHEDRGYMEIKVHAFLTLELNRD
jgi:hypothetical protein